jgi:O-antigen/teichoic acid export membrane protein
MSIPQPMADQQSAGVGRLARESLLVSGASYAAYGCLLVFTILLTRFHGAAELGRFALAFAASQLLIESLSSGFSAVLRRDIAVAPDRATVYTGNFLLLRGAAVVVAFAVLLAARPLYGASDPAFMQVLLLVFVSRGVDALTNTFESVYQALEQFRLYTVMAVLRPAGMLLVAAILLATGSVPAIVYAALIGNSLLMLGLNALLMHKLIGRLSLAPQRRVLGYALREVWPLFVTALIFAVSSRMAIFIVAHFHDTESVGVFAAALNVVHGASLFASGTAIVVFPLLCRTFRDEPTRFPRLVRNVTAAVALAGAAAAALLVLSAPWVVWLYGGLSPEALPVLRVLALGLVPLFAQAVMGYLFTAMQRQVEGMYFTAIVTLLNFGLYLLLVGGNPLVWGAIAFVAAHLIWVLAATVWLYTRYFGRMSAASAAAARAPARRPAHSLVRESGSAGLIGEK